MALARGEGVLASWPDGGAPPQARTASFAFDADALAAGDAAALVTVLRDARRGLGDFAALDVALAAPLCTPRLVQLPALRDAEAHAILERDALRYFPAARSEPVVTSRRIAASDGTRWFAADAESRVVAAIHAAAQQAGFASVRVVPATLAWAHAAGDASSAFIIDGLATLVSARAGDIADVRTLRAHDVGAGTSTVTDALERAARHAPFCGDGELTTRPMRAERQRLASRRAAQLVAIGALALVLAAVTRWWGVERAVDRINADRAALRTAVAPVLAARDSLVALRDGLGAIGQAEAGAPSWTTWMSTIAAALPDDAYLTALRGSADSVVVEGRATSTAVVLDAICAARGVRSVHASAPVQVGDGADATEEQFRIVVRFGAEEPR